MKSTQQASLRAVAHQNVSDKQKGTQPLQRFVDNREMLSFEKIEQKPQSSFKVSPQGQGVIQRQVFKKSNGKYYSDYDPSLEFDSRENALEYEHSMEPPPPISGGRAPTLYTHISTKWHNKISSRGIPQGPHTVGHAAIEKALFETEGNISIEAVAAEQVMAPEEWRDAVTREFNGDSSLWNGQTFLSLQLLRAYQYYNGLYQELQRVLRQESDENPLDLIHELIQLDPYTVYGYTNPGSITKKHLKNKGETSDLSDPKNIDTLGHFRDNEMYKRRVEDRKDLLDYDYKYDSEDVDTDEKSEDLHGDEEEFKAGMMVDGPLEDDPQNYNMQEYDELAIEGDHYHYVTINFRNFYYREKEIDQDGNCFFNTMLTMGIGDSVEQLRQIAEQNGGQQNIQVPNTWANYNDLTAIAHHFGIQLQVAVISLDGSVSQTSSFGSGGNIYTLAHINNGHFTPLYQI